MKANLIALRYECPKCRKDMSLQERKGTVNGYERRCRSQSKDNPHDVVLSRQALECLLATRVGPPSEGSETTQPRTLIGQIK
ncbi:hypothetical protein TNCV_1167131 [Trichonephila clavipes]|uniref:Uncharacterized protein n=1 Tax=Trichonephila clavipes TaxID=2585209 RepID=A0A8X6T1J0_TRICX|nr:hypothetical protein TNCV_1167131 [Trichonephila clavipes]